MEKDNNAQTITLEHNLRNTEFIVNASNSVPDNLGDPNDFTKLEKNLTGDSNYYFINEQNYTLWMLVVAVIEKLFSNNNEPVVVLTDHSEEILYNYLKKHLNRQVTFLPQKDLNDSNVQDINNFLDEPTGVLVTSESTFHGAQARNIIIVIVNAQFSSIRNVILRTTAFAYIIDHRNGPRGAETVPGLEKDNNLPHFISKHQAFFYNNNKQCPEYIIAETVIKEYFKNKLRNNLYIIANNKKEMFSYLNKVLGDKLEIIQCENTQDVEYINKKAGSIVIYPKYFSISYDYIKEGQNMIMFPTEYALQPEIEDFFESKYRNMILSVRPEFALVIDGDFSLYAPCIELKDFKLNSLNSEYISTQVVNSVVQNKVKSKPIYISKEVKERLCQKRNQARKQLEYDLAQIAESRS